MSKLIHTAFLFLLMLRIHAQSLTLPSIEDLEASITSFTMQELDAKIKAFEISENSGWQELLPSFGITYTPSGSPRPSASWSPLQFLDRKDKKKKEDAELESLRLTYELILYERIHKLKELCLNYLIDQESIKLEDEKIEIEEKLYAIDEEKYKQHIIKPSIYLKSKKRLIEMRVKLKLARMEQSKKFNAILYVAKWDLEN